MNYTEKIKARNEDYFNKTGKRRLMFCRTFGCQMNSHDTEKIIGILTEMGFGQAEDEKSANIIVFNTCCVRESAENKIYGNIGWLKNIKESKKKNEYKIIVCGCMTQQESAMEKIKRSHNHIDVVLGTFNLHRLPELLWSSYETRGQIIDIWKEHGEIVEDLPVARESAFKASVNVMYGCNNFCSYCIVPYVRGRERSRKPADILKEIKNIAESGVKEVLLLGQNVNSYGSNLDEKVDFAVLLEMIAEIDGIERIRFLTSHPKDLSERLIKTMRDSEKICKQLHLPFQAGSNNILEKMNRKYTKEHYLKLIERLREEMPEISLSTDIIVGFPGETEEDFEHTLDVVKQARFSGAFTFYYSKRTGTPAAQMENQVSEEAAKDRFDRLLETINPIILEENKKCEGKILKVLAEGLGENGIMTGRAENNSLVHFTGGTPDELTGRIVDVKITKSKTFYLQGELVYEIDTAT